MKGHSVAVILSGVMTVIGCVAGGEQVRLTSAVSPMHSGEVVIDAGSSGATISITESAVEGGDDSIRCHIRNRRHLDGVPNFVEDARVESCFAQDHSVAKLKLDNRLSTFAITSARPRHLVLNATNPPDNVFFAGLMTCSNHEEAHLARSFDEMKELSKDPPGCRRWRFVGAITNDGEMLAGLEIGLQTFDAAALELLEGRDGISDSVLFQALTSPIWFPYKVMSDIGGALQRHKQHGHLEQ